MRFQTPLVPAVLLRRYKRFLADMRLADGCEVVAHVANPGAMTGLAEPGARAWLEPNDDPRKKLDFGWRLAELAAGGLCGVDTGAANRIVAEALGAGRIPELAGYAEIRPEQRYGTRSRVDFLLQGGTGGGSAHVEVKSVTLSRRPGLAEFPDCVTARGARHLNDLAEIADAGGRAVMLFLVQRNDCARIALANDIDPGYARAMAQARAAGIEVLGYSCTLDPGGIELGAPLPVD